MADKINDRFKYQKAKDFLEKAKSQAASEYDPTSVQKADLLQKRLEKQVVTGSDFTPPSKHVGKGYTEKIDTKQVLKELSGTDFAKKIAKSRAAKSVLKGGLKSIPFLGGLATALVTGETEAAVPLLNEAESLGPESGSLESMVEDPSISTEDRVKILQKLKDQYK